MIFNIPENIKIVLNILHNAGFEAYIVGGCVRDFLMGKVPHDYDICTSARPEEIKRCFADFVTIDTGIIFGTVVVVSDGENVEVTTYRIDGNYEDSRHPECVNFTPELREDLARRDFTVNALAYSEDQGLIDFFNGIKDINEKKLVAVGNPEKRFEEDALRIMRALRFASVLGFKVEKSTDIAIRKRFSDIENVSKERIQVELSKLIMGKDADRILKEYRKELKSVIAGIVPDNVSNKPENTAYRLGVLFPENTGIYLKKLKFDNKRVKIAKAVAEIRKENIPEDQKNTLFMLKKYGEDVVKLYFEEAEKTDCLITIINDNPCYSIKQLDITGSDLINIGIRPGPDIGNTLERILNMVIEGKLENKRERILEYLNGDIRNE